MSYTGTGAAVGTGSLLTCNTTATLLGTTPLTIGEPFGSFDLQIKNMFEDATNQQSAGMECIGIFPDYPKMTVECNRLPADTGQGAIRTAGLANTKLFFKYQMAKGAGQTTTGDAYTFAGFVENLTESTPPNKKMSTKFDLKITNGLTFVAGS